VRDLWEESHGLMHITQEDRGNKKFAQATAHDLHFKTHWEEETIKFKEPGLRCQPAEADENKWRNEIVHKTRFVSKSQFRSEYPACLWTVWSFEESLTGA
jgi:hypothetical protein